MKLGVICGSHRRNSQSSKVAHYIRNALLRNECCDEVYLYDLAGETGLYNAARVREKMAETMPVFREAHVAPAAPAHAH